MEENEVVRHIKEDKTEALNNRRRASGKFEDTKKQYK